MKSKHIFVFAVIILVLSLGAASASDLNQTDIIKDSANTFQDIQNTVNNASDNDVIYLEGTYTGNGKPITVDKPLTIESKSKLTLDGNGKSGIININSNNVVLKNINFINGKSEYGGAIQFKGSNYTFDNCVFTNNKADFGGAISGEGLNITVKNCRFEKNTANYQGGAVQFNSYWDLPYDIIASGNEYALFEATSFSENKVTDGYGGAIYFKDSKEYLSQVFRKATFSKNTAQQGGGIYIEASNLTVSNSKFISNKAEESGGGIYWSGISGKITDCAFTSNTASTMYGGAILCYGISYPTACENISRYIDNGDVTIRNTNFTSNSAEYGGAVYSQMNGGFKSYYTPPAKFPKHYNSVFVDNCNFIKNRAIYNAATISWDSEHNSDSYFNIYTIKITNSNFESNKINKDYVSNGILGIFGDDNIVSNCKFTSNSATNDGGAIGVIGSNNTLIKCSFNNNSAVHEGGAVFFAGNGLKILQCKFTNNVADVGGAINLYGLNQTIADCIFTNNKAKIYGGAINWAGPFNNYYQSLSPVYTINGRERLLIANSTFKSNYAPNTGAISGNPYSYEPKSYRFNNASAYKYNPCIIDGCTFEKNRAKYTTAAISWDGYYESDNKKSYLNTITIKNSRFDNHAPTEKSSMTSTLSIEGNRNLISNCTFSNGKCFEQGAVSVCGDNNRIIDSRFTSNIAEIDGGALYIKGSNEEVMNCVFENNKAKSSYNFSPGGAIYGLVKNSVISGCVFRGNYASGNGGAVALCTGSKYNGNTITKSVFIKNSAEVGGAVSAGSGKITNCIFDSNKDRDDSKEEIVTFGGTAFYGKATLTNNFYGFNIKSTDDFITANLVSAKKRTDIVKVSSWVNLKLVKSSNNSYKLKFVTNKGSDITSMPDYKVTIKDKSGKVIVSNLLIRKGVGEFTSTKSLSMNNIQILNSGYGQIEKSKVTIQASNFKSSYGSGATMNIKVLDSNRKAVKNVKVCILVDSGKKEKAYWATTDSKGIAKFQASLVEAGTHKAKIVAGDVNYRSSKITKTLKTTKSKATVSVPKVYAKYKKSHYIKITLKHAQTKKLMPGVKVDVSILRSGNMGFADTYITNSKGVVLIQTSGLKKATYTVSVKSGTSSCTFSAKSSVVIR